MAVTQAGVLYTAGADGDIIPGLFPLAAILFDSAGVSGACVVKINGAGGNIIYSAIPTDSIQTWFVPAGGDPLIVNNLEVTTIGANVTIRVLRSPYGNEIAERVSVA
jgi:hypothetical protein